MDTYLQVDSALRKISEVVVPDTLQEIENIAILSNTAQLTHNYIVEMSENNKCIKKLMDDISDLTHKLRCERAKVNALETEYNSNFGRTNFSNFGRKDFTCYMRVIRNRDPSDTEWNLFYENFLNGIDFSKAIYKYIETNIGE